jgi:hypothetical protein
MPILCQFRDGVTPALKTHYASDMLLLIYFMSKAYLLWCTFKGFSFQLVRYLNHLFRDI